MPQTLLEPYERRRDNQLERLSLWTTLATLYLAMFLVTDAAAPYGGERNITLAGRYVISYLIIAGNAATIAVFLYFVLTGHYALFFKAMGLEHVRRSSDSVAEVDAEIRKVLAERFGTRTSALASTAVRLVVHADRFMIRSFDSLKKRASRGRRQP